MYPAAVPSTERNLAAMAHLSGIFFPFLGPFCFWLFAAQSRFVRFHSLHALVGALLLNLLLFTLGAISITLSLVSLYRNYQEGWQHFNIWQVLLKSAVTWLVIALIGLANTIANVFQARGAFQGDTPQRGLTSAVVRRLLGESRALSAS